MSDDFQMSDVRQISPKSPSDAPSPPPASTTSRSSSTPSIHDHNIEPSTSRPKSPQTVPVVDNNDPQHLNPLSIVASSSAKPVSTKPKSTKRPRSRSPSPPPPPPPLKTIRLDIQLGGPDHYEVDIAGMAKATGQRPPTPVPVKRDSSDSEPDDDPETKDKDKDKDKTTVITKSKKKRRALDYDLDDPFIDDSELAVDERTYFAQTKQQGFYVSSGEVALMKDKTPKKPKSKKRLPLSEKASASAAGPSSATEGTKDTPIALSDGEDDITGAKRKNNSSAVEGNKKRKTHDHEFHPELQAAIDEMKVAIAKESWEVKGKFPPAIKPVLAKVALKAVQLNEYDDRFFTLMPKLFPYNKFTMTKLIKRTIFHDHTRILMERQQFLLEDLAELTAEGFPKAQEEWEKSVVQWERRQERAKAEAEASAEADNNPPLPGTASTSTTPAPAQHGDDPGSGMEQDSADKDGAGKDGGAGAKDGHGPPSHPPTKKYRMTDAMKVVIWQLVSLSNECCRLENDKNALENSPLQVSEQGLRKILYQKIVAAFPDGWMSSGQISREVSSMKKRLEKEAMENEA